MHSSNFSLTIDSIDFITQSAGCFDHTATMTSSIPKTHKAAMFKEKGGPLVVDTVETKQPVEGEVLMKVLATGVCHSDALVPVQAFGTPLYVFSSSKTRQSEDQEVTMVNIAGL